MLSKNSISEINNFELSEKFGIFSWVEGQGHHLIQEERQSIPLPKSTPLSPYATFSLKEIHQLKVKPPEMLFWAAPILISIHSLVE
jgi:hypothetical protein